MNRFSLNALTLACALCTLPTWAQSTTQIFGRLDIGLTHTSNVGGHSRQELSSGMATPSFIAFRGSEDLGGGTRALYYLQANVDVDTGQQPTNQAGFAAASYLGLSHAGWGELTIGRQKDFTMDMGIQRFDANLDVGGLNALRGGPYPGLQLPLNANGGNWDRLAGFALSNSFKYVSPNLGGLRLGAMVALGEADGSNSRNGAWSLHARQDIGNFGWGVTLSDVKFPSVNNGEDGARIGVAGVRWRQNSWRFNGLYSSVRNTFTGAAVNAVELGAVQSLSPSWTWGVSAQWMHGNQRSGGKNARQFSAQLSNHLSKRTTVYITPSLQIASSGTRATINRQSPSSSNRQAVLRVGISTAF
jgi:predicted porin